MLTDFSFFIQFSVFLPLFIYFLGSNFELLIYTNRYHMELSLAKGKLMTARKPMRLKDYLVDELSSCSSNGFRSYPRRLQSCTTTVRLLDLKNMKKPKSSISAFQRASNALINAVKHLPFTSSITSTLSRKLSRKLLKRCFSKKTEEKSSLPKQLSFTGRNSGSSMSNNGETYCWSDHEYLPCSRVNNEVNNLNKKMNKIAAVIVCGGDSAEATSDSSSSSSCISSSSSAKKPLRIEEEKEQFSPVSVLDCQFEDEEVSSLFQQTLAQRFKGSNKRQMKKTKKLEAINMETRIALMSSESFDPASPFYASSQSSSEELIECKVDDDDYYNAESKAFKLLKLIRVPSMNISDKLLLDFFREGIEIGQNETMGLMSCVDTCDYKELLKTANDWLRGETSEERDLKKKKMETCLGEMEKEGKWSWKCDEEKKHIVLELEVEVFASLVNEVLHDYYFFFL